MTHPFLLWEKKKIFWNPPWISQKVKCGFKVVLIQFSSKCFGVFFLINQVQLVFLRTLFRLGISGRILPWSQSLKIIRWRTRMLSPSGSLRISQSPMAGRPAVQPLGICKQLPPMFISTGGWLKAGDERGLPRQQEVAHLMLMLN